MKERSSDKRQALYKLADYLARRDHSAQELRSKLLRKFTTDAVQWALKEATEQGWMSPPEELAERVALSLQRKKKGAKYIQRYLAEKGLPKVPVSTDSEKKNALTLLEEKFGPPSQLTYEEKQKAFNFLYRRGFEDVIIRHVLFSRESLETSNPEESL
ncbi:MAG: regulatory protein RecX [Bdellovibrionales bacterium]|nr:regulatory protein RecX [Bdellovibrionales bacterium]